MDTGNHLKEEGADERGPQYLSMSQARRILESTTDAVLVVDKEGRITYTNQQTEPLLKRSRFDLIGGKLLEEFPVMADGILHRRYRDAIEHNTLQQFEAFCNALDIWLEVKAIPSDVGLWVYLRDITAKKRMEEALDKCLETQNQMLKLMMSAQEVERRRISMELHDGPLQLLAVSLMAAERAIKRADQGETEAVKTELQSITETLHETIHEMRSVLADLSPEVLSTYGLAMAIQSHAERFSEATGMEVLVRNQITNRLPAETELLLYRLAQEALANARKHSHANRIVIELERTDDEMTLTIRDNGNGFDVEDALNKHKDGDSLGLKSMRQRIEAGGGSMRITSAPSEGTAISFHYPLGK